MRSTDLTEPHRDAWRIAHQELSVEKRDFLFSFRFDEGKFRVEAVRSTALPAPLRQRTIYLMSCRLAAIRRRENREIPVPIDQQPQWLADLLQRNGFRLLRIFDLRTEVFRIPRTPLHTAVTRFAATVADLQAASRAYQFGIGRHRAWGCGMLTIEQEASTS